MNKYYIALDKQYNYVSALLTKRNQFTPTTLTQEILIANNSPYKLINHAVNTLYHYSVHDFYPAEDAQFQDLFNESAEDLTDDIVFNYGKAIIEFSRAIHSIDPAIYTQIKENLGNLVMHSIGHIAQAVRLQKMNIERD